MAREPFNEVWAESPDGPGPNTFQRPDNTRIAKGWVGGAQGEAPKAGEENWWHNRVDMAMQQIERQGALEWHPDSIYGIGGYAVGSDGRRYRSVSDENSGNDPTVDGGENWTLAPRSLEVSATEPTATYAYQRWWDTSGAAPVLKLRNAANDGWHTLGTIASGAWVPYSAGESADQRYARLVGSNDFSEMPTVDGEALITELAALDAIPPAVNAAIAEDIDFTIIYPNGGSEASPADVAVNSRYVEVNPFPGHHLIMVAQLQYNGIWGDVEFSSIYSQQSHSVGVGVKMLGDTVVIKTGSIQLINTRPSASDSPWPPPTFTAVGPLPCRIKVWKVKGAIS